MRSKGRGSKSRNVLEFLVLYIINKAFLCILLLYFLKLFMLCVSLVRYLTRESWVDVASIKVISNTAIPVIKLRTVVMPYVVSLDISFEGMSHKG